MNGRGDLPASPSPPHQMQVLSIVHSAAFGGPHNQAVQLHREFERTGVGRLTVVMPDEPGDGPDRLRASGVAVVQMPLLRPHASRDKQGLVGLLTGYPGQILRLRRLVKTSGIDVVEVHGLLNLDGAIAGRLAGRGVVWQLIDTRPPPVLRWMLMPLVLLLADVIMTTGEAVAAEYPGTHLRPRRLIPFIPPVGPTVMAAQGLDEEGGCTRQRLSVSDEALLIASVGNLNPQKGYEQLIDAVADCRKRGSVADLQLRIRGAVQSGHESYADRLRSRARHLGLPPETIGAFEPSVDPAQLMRASDIFALTSRPRSEGLPTVILEAMSFGVPVVATAVGSIAEIVSDGVSGVLLRPGDPGQLTDAIDTLAGNPAERARLGRRGREVVAQRASPESFAGCQMQAYRLAVGSHRPQQRPGDPEIGGLNVRLMLIHPWAGLPSRQSLYIGLEEVTGWDLMIVTARRWKDDYGRTVRATPDPKLRGRLLALPVGLSGNIPLHFFVSGLKHHIREFSPDCIYIYHEPYAVGTYQMVSAAKSVTSIPVGVRSAQNIAKRYPTPFRQWERTVYRRSDFAVVVSENVAQVMRDKGYRRPIRVVPMPVDTATFFPAAEVADARADSGPLRLGFVGRLVPEKGMDTALKALASLPAGTADLTVIGDGPQRSALVELAASLGISDAVRWRGSLDRQATADAYRAFDVVLVPSKATERWREQFGRVVIEAAATGVPVIATRSGELPFLVDSIGAGWIVEEEDAGTMADILASLCADRGSLVEIGHRLRQCAEEKYSDRTIVGQLVDTFTEAVVRHRTP